MDFEFVEVDIFSKQISGILTDDEYVDLQAYLISRPMAGALRAYPDITLVLQDWLLACAFTVFVVHTALSMNSSPGFGSAQNPSFRQPS